MTDDTRARGDTMALKVWWIPQVSGKPFEVLVETSVEARLLLDTLAAYDLFQCKNHVKPDYANAGGLMIWEDGEWVDWYDDEGNGIDHEKFARVAAETQGP